MKERYYAMLEDDGGFIEVTSFEYNYNGHFWLCDGIDGKGYDSYDVLHIKNNELHSIERPLDADDGGGKQVIYIDPDALPEELRGLVDKK